MKSNNALVTYTDLTTMGLLQQAGTNPPIGNRMATKSFINTYYHANADSLAVYANNQLPPYQRITPQLTPFLFCYNLTINTSYIYDSCGNSQTAENWTITLIDQFGNSYITPTNQIFTIAYDYIANYDVYPYYVNEIRTTNLIVSAGNYHGFAQFINYWVEACPYSGTCSGECYYSETNANLVNGPTGINGGCSLPPPPPPGPCAYTQINFPQGFSPNGDGVNDVWRFEGKKGGVWEVLNYSCFPHTTWRIFDVNGNNVYVGTNTTYVPWNGKLNNTGYNLPDGGYYYYVDLGDGAGNRQGYVIIAT